MEVACDEKSVSELMGKQAVWRIAVATIADPKDTLHQRIDASKRLDRGVILLNAEASADVQRPSLIHGVISCNLQKEREGPVRRLFIPHSRARAFGASGELGSLENFFPRLIRKKFQMPSLTS
jgi:hypothetical protein